MKVCVFCRTQYKKGSGVTFHKFPSDNSLRLWLKNMNLKNKNWTPRECDFLCSKHFTEHCFIRHHSRTALKRCSVPTIFLETDSLLATAQSEQKSSNDDSQISDKKIKKEEVEEDIKPKVGVSTTHEDKVNPHNVSSTRKGIKRNQSSGFVKQDDIIVPSTSCDSTQCGTPKRDSRTCAEICASVVHDHPYENSAQSSEKTLQRVKTALKSSRACVKALSAHVKRLKVTVNRLKRVIVHLKKGGITI